MEEAAKPDCLGAETATPEPLIRHGVGSRHAYRDCRRCWLCGVVARA